MPRLQLAHQTVDELVKVYKEYGQDYDREKAYTEEIDVAMKEAADKRMAKEARTTGQHDGASRLGDTKSMGMKPYPSKTGKLNTTMLRNI